MSALYDTTKTTRSAESGTRKMDVEFQGLGTLSLFVVGLRLRCLFPGTSSKKRRKKHEVKDFSLRQGCSRRE